VVPATVATPMAVVLNELLQNTADHAFPTGGEGGLVTIRLCRDGRDLVVEVVDNGQGLPEGFDVDASGGLGLSIVRTLVTSELAGTIQMEPAADGSGTAVVLRVPIEGRPA
jgi:two-component sensor histidine kinase